MTTSRIIGHVQNFAAGGLALAAAGAVALAISAINHQAPSLEAAAGAAGLLLGVLTIAPGLLYVALRRRSADSGVLGTLVLGAATVGLVAIYFYRVSFYVAYPADILTWSESDFVNDIVKLRTGYPLYTAQQNNESFIYPPTAPLLTYFLAWLSGRPTSITAYRAIQVGYTIAAAAVAMLCCHRLAELRGVRSSRWTIWSPVLLPFFVLMGSNSLTNPFAHNLHNDALSLLGTTIAYWLLLEYLVTGKKAMLLAMAAMPAIGFFIKQTLAIWTALYTLALALEGRVTRSTLALFAAASVGGIAAIVAISYWIWGEPFIYWVLTVLGSGSVSVVRGTQHLLAAWAHLAIGLFGGFVLIRGRNDRALLIAWLTWLVLFLSEAYTSGIAWMMNHLGPGSLIAAIWFMAAVVRLWPSSAVPNRTLSRQSRMRFAVGVAILLLCLNGLAIVRVPLRPVSDDAYRYPAEIERAFEGERPDTVLLDVGSWIYLRAGVVMKDRATTIGDRALGGIGDFSGIRRRIEEKRYAKILVRGLHDKDSWYDHYLWPESSGIRRALLENYHEVGRIARVAGARGELSYLFRDITILVPTTNGAGDRRGRGL